MLNRLLVNTLIKPLRRLPTKPLTLASRFSTQKPNQKDNDLEQQKVQDYKYEEAAGSRNTTGWWIYRAFIYGSFAIFAYHVYNIAYGEKPKIVKKVDENGNVVNEKVYSFSGIPGFYYFADGFVYYAKRTNLVNPPAKKLLPTPLHPLMHPKTLVFDLSGTVVVSDYIVGKGRKLTVRPGFLKAIEKLSKQYQIVFWGDDDMNFMMQTLVKMGLQQMAQMSFGRECLSWTWDQGFQRNLKYLNRDIRNVIVVDKDLELSKNFPNNVIRLSEFKGDTNDNEIDTLVQILDRMKNPNVTDVRTVISKLGDNPIEKFREVGSKVKSEQAEVDKKRKYWSGKLGK